MHTIGIVGSSPLESIPNLQEYKEEIDLWIGVDSGSLTILSNHFELTYAVGDFDSVTNYENEIIKENASYYLKYPVEKDKTDLEIAIEKAVSMKPQSIYLFGVTGGRLDHEFINIQQLLLVVNKGINGFIVDQQNILQLVLPNTYQINNNENYPYISFIPFSEHIKGLTLKGFYYSLHNKTISWGSTLCVSNKLVSNNGTFLFDEGILLVIKSRD